MGPIGIQSCTAFDHTEKVASGSVKDVARKVKEYLKKHPKAGVLIFDDVTSQQVEIDLRGTVDAVMNRLEEAEAEAESPDLEKKQGPGRPKLGVVAKEVTLLPQHWEWLALQPGGASVTLRKLVEDAKKKNLAKDQLRQAQEAVHKFMTAMAGDLPNYEESLRALYARDAEKFSKLVSGWPKDIRDHVRKLAKPVM